MDVARTVAGCVVGEGGAVAMVTVDGSTAAVVGVGVGAGLSSSSPPSTTQPLRRVRGGGAANLSDTGVILVNSFSSRVVTNSLHGGRAKLLTRLSRGPRCFFLQIYLLLFFPYNMLYDSAPATDTHAFTEECDRFNNTCF